MTLIAYTALALQNSWEDALRVAKVYGGINASKQVRECAAVSIVWAKVYCVCKAHQRTNNCNSTHVSPVYHTHLTTQVGLHFDHHNVTTCVSHIHALTHAHSYACMHAHRHTHTHTHLTLHHRWPTRGP